MRLDRAAGSGARARALPWRPLSRASPPLMRAPSSGANAFMAVSQATSPADLISELGYGATASATVFRSVLASIGIGPAAQLNPLQARRRGRPSRARVRGRR